MTLLLGGISALFLGFCGSYMYNRIQQDVKPIALPGLFYINTLILAASSLTLFYSKKAYKYDNTERYKISLVATTVLTIFFLISQIMAWKQLIDSNVLINHSNLASYLYIISGIHFLHVIAGIPFLIYFVYIAYTKLKSPVSVLLYFSDKEKYRGLNLLNIYWHFLDILWILLVIFFFANYILS
jgi:cytochrome c oxidase subunit 3